MDVTVTGAVLTVSPFVKLFWTRALKAMSNQWKAACDNTASSEEGQFHWDGWNARRHDIGGSKSGHQFW